MYYPSLEEVQRLAAYVNLIPIYREINADLETPVSAYLKVAHGSYSFLLESIEGGERIARYSFIGTDPYSVVRTGPKQSGGEVDPLEVIMKELNQFKLVTVPGLPRFHGGAVGYLGYECVRYFEPKVPPPKDDPLGLPESIFMFTDTLLVFDHLKHKIKVVSHVHANGDLDSAYSKAVARIDRLVDRLYGSLEGKSSVSAPADIEYLSNVSSDQYRTMVEKAKKYIYEGDVIQVVLSQRLSRPTTAAPFDIYRALRAVNPSPYMYFLHLEDFHIAGASPELLVRVEDGEVDTHPIAGTRPRGLDTSTDDAMAEELRGDEKERAEHIMLVDLGRNDIGRVSEPGTVRVTQLMDVERYSHVMHLVSHISGHLRSGLDSYDALRACFPAGTVSGAPKIRAMEIIAELEPEARGPYAGAVGYFSFSGNMDTAITIRTIVVKDGVVFLQAGGGVVADSTPDGEYQESLHKARALMRAIEEAEDRG